MRRALTVLILAFALYLGIWDCIVTLSLSAVHAWLIDLVGRTGVWVIIALTTLGGGWAVWSDQEDR
ncbi:hypothetical protein [Methylorubrum zatmanii]|uniref:DUF378 domain-containing protein n=1 Tax=Methylorubrum zatmanii TaxID=29429 RepID=A0ABW1WHI9_9HYPH|nr:hypothetical protein [Methylorubrum zatmanii]MBD8905809.1 hypothetical protein [Methylorubrum zatmanii]